MKNANAKVRAKQQKSEKRSKAAVSALMCLAIVFTAATVAVSAFTDVFKAESEVKAVALVLTAEEEQDLEAQLSKLAPLAEIGFDGDKSDAAELLGFIKPSAQSGLYHSFGYELAVPSEIADPAMRFKDENGKYKYYKVTKNRVDTILSQFDVNVDHTVNLEDVYYYDGYYYFAESENDSAANEAKADITASKRVQDGRYYVTATLSGKTVYVIADRSQDGAEWKFHEISLSPIFDQLGIMIKQEQEGLFDFDMKTQIIEGKTKNGTVYSRFVLEYPVFYGETAGETEANRFFQSVLSYYTQQASDCEKQYKLYLKSGGEDSALPIETTYKAAVTYAAGDYIGITNEISESAAVTEKPEENTGEPTPVVPSKKTMECYVFDTETGTYVNKDSIIGKDYQLLESLLYRIYCGYDYTALLDDSVQDSAEVPDDVDDLGEDIYDSANTICEEGYMFCYINDSGYREDVVIPFGLSVFEIEK